jgi:ERCC4-type nuclease
MDIRIWRNPHKPGDSRAYINAVEGAAPDTKAFITAQGDGCRLSVRPAAEAPRVRAALAGAGLPGDAASLKRTPFSAIEALAKAPRATRAAPGRGGGSRVPEANALDLHAIKIPDPVSITIDHREPAELFDLFAGLHNVVVERAELDVGDIHVNDGQIIIERKCCTGDNRSDLEASIIDEDKRLFHQSEKLRLREGAVPIIVIEGPAHEGSRSLGLDAVDGAISFLVALQGLSVINTLSLNHTAFFILRLATHARSGLGYSLSLRGKKPSLLSDQVAFTLEGIPGISATIARALSARFGSIAGVVAATREELLDTPHLGQKRLAALWPVLHGTGDEP